MTEITPGPAVKLRKGDPCPIVENGAACGKPVLGAAMCAMHYRRSRVYGDPLVTTRRYVRQGPECTHEGCDRKPKRRGMCEKHAKRDILYGETTEPYERRFWAQVNKAGPVPESKPELGPCWVWTGYIHTETGYGQYGGKGNGSQLTHRIAYQYEVGPIPKSLHLDHLCRNRACCNPDHLEPVTPRENIRRGDQGAFWGYVPQFTPPASPQLALPICAACGGADRPIYKSGKCRPCYRRWLKDPSVQRPSQRTPEQRFWEKVNKRGPIPEHVPGLGRCWLWTAGINRITGYGRFGRRHGEMVDAHRFSYELANRSIPAGLDVHHKCHLRHCVNPAHLEAVTRAENMRQRKNRRKPAA